jgi:hypothetical protein
VNAVSHDIGEAADAGATLRFELKRCQRERGECQNRMRELEQAEALLAGEPVKFDGGLRGMAAHFKEQMIVP